jgi:hypothetical protein
LQIPVVSNLKELSPAPRRFLFFIAFNVVSWQCIIGPAMILLARKIDMPPSWVGFLNSFTPFTTLLVVFTAPVIARMGPKWVMFTAWLVRNILMCGVYFMPLAIYYGGNRAGWFVLSVSTLGFCLMRALGAGGWFPWLHEVVPEEQRGTYFSGEAALTQLINILIMLAQSLLLLGDPGVGRFLIVYSLGIGAGFISLFWMARIPGGHAQKGVDIRSENYHPHRAALRDRRFVVFVLTAAFCVSATSWFASAYVLYLRDALHLSPQIIMLLGAVGSLGILVTIRFWGLFADYSGSGRAMSKALIGHSVCVVAFLFLWPGAPWTLYVLAPMLVLVGIFCAAFNISVNRAMLNFVTDDERVGYANIWTIGTALSYAITPILVGFLIDHFGLWGFRACFIIAGGLGLLCAVACLWVVRDGEPLDLSPQNLLDPGLPVRTLVRIVSITVGFHESNR